MIAALYVEPDGVYAGLPDVDAWDESRDARLYSGPWPVVAHPPCQRWGNLGLVNWHRWGGDHNRPGNDGGCFGDSAWPRLTPQLRPSITVNVSRFMGQNRQKPH
jgi:hypothetical protein